VFFFCGAMFLYRILWALDGGAVAAN